MSGESPAAGASSPVIHEVFPYLIVRGAAAAIDFYTRVFEKVSREEMQRRFAAGSRD